MGDFWGEVSVLGFVLRWRLPFNKASANRPCCRLALDVFLYPMHHFADINSRA